MKYCRYACIIQSVINLDVINYNEDNCKRINVLVDSFIYCIEHGHYKIKNHA
jgi:hypothetical protein